MSRKRHLQGCSLSKKLIHTRAGNRIAAGTNSTVTILYMCLGIQYHADFLPTASLEDTQGGS